MSNEDKKYLKLMDEVDDVNPYSTYLSESTFSNVDEWIDTGSLALNAIISKSLYGGIPVGRVTQFAGPSMTGKTFFVQKIIANAQKMGKFVIVFDSENAIDADGAIALGIDPTKVKYVPTTTIENTRNAIFKFLKKVAEAGALGKFLIIVDSLAQMESELGEKRMGDDNNASDMGTFAKSIKSCLKTLVNWSKITKTAVVVTNEVYDNPSQMFPSIEKNIAGGRAAAYKPSVTVQLGRTPAKADDASIDNASLAAGQERYSGVFLSCLTVKNRFAKQYLKVNLYLSYATGLDKFYGLLEIMKDLKIVNLEGKTYTDFTGESMGYYKNWRKDKNVWKKLLPELEKRIQSEWSYSNEEPPLEDDDIDSEQVSEEPKVEDTPLEKLKKTKKKITSKLDKLEVTVDPIELTETNDLD